VDLGIPPIVARDQHVASRLRDISYLQVEGNRFARGLSDIPAGMRGRSDPPKPRRSSISSSPRIQAIPVKTFRSEKIWSRPRSLACNSRWRARP
jgi:hypothetical protein